ncbi:MAG: hypothetical protein Kow0075_01280 [Salibacteraceae bacterium]
MSEKLDGYRALVLDGYIRNSLAIVKSLSGAGVRCDVVVERHPVQLYAWLQRSLRSRYITKVFEIDVHDEEGALASIEEILKTGHYDFLLAGGTHYSNFLSKNKSTLSKYSHVLIEDYEKLRKVHDKHSCMEFAARIGVPVPETYRIRDVYDLKTVADKTGGKVIVKFSDSFASKGLRRFAGSKEEFVEAYQREIGFSHKQNNQPVVQRLILGDLVDSTAFSVAGDAKAVLTQKRELTAWLDGGGGIVNITTDHPEIKEHTRTLLQELKWTGHIEMDWIVEEKTGKVYLIEINPKFWGTTQLTISAGLDYPLWFCLTALGKPPKYTQSYRVGLRFRWIDDELVTIFTQPRSLQRFVTEFEKFIKRFFQKNTISNFDVRDPASFLRGLIDASILIVKGWVKSLRR